MTKSNTDANTDIKPIRLLLKNADSVSEDVTDHALLQKRLGTLTSVVNDAYRQRYGGAGGPADAIALLAIISDFLQLMPSLDSQYGIDAELPMSDAEGAVDEALRCLVELGTWLERLDLAALQPNIVDLQLGIGYWAMRHHLAIDAAEAIVNALATRSNAAETRQETAAVYALMQGFVQHLSPALSADLERSNPERPWRLLNLNFAITAIRTGDAAMMRYAFDALNTHLPDERSGFYEEAYALASQPGFPPETKSIIESEYARWTGIQ